MTKINGLLYTFIEVVAAVIMMIAQPFINLYNYLVSPREKKQNESTH